MLGVLPVQLAGKPIIFQAASNKGVESEGFVGLFAHSLP